MGNSRTFPQLLLLFVHPYHSIRLPGVSMSPSVSVRLRRRSRIHCQSPLWSRLILPATFQEHLSYLYSDSIHHILSISPSIHIEYIRLFGPDTRPSYILVPRYLHVAYYYYSTMYVDSDFIIGHLTARTR
ncbi:hypothetical protein ASPWEDRAFT_361983 [Aspergillus wentii DTO 134E9]|uniref:Uncharacterized protein n=1 Tax=Aspergillus wentii DTO 134E9 TaxID=1073089 RepID=A0A1L9RWI6_ASPWE|nr:uncharacterized protein ASPWEDRAFT_361983 [Aspergillus wentii DTO 134E9]OJJ39208.1 hypothetical protein ASPWEDRAFT_361983 [Aspergillus wentii DTO 134E9]